MKTTTIQGIAKAEAAPQESKRGLCKTLACLLFGSTAANSAPLLNNQATEAKQQYIFCTHGHSLSIAHPDRVEVVNSEGASKKIKGRSFSRNQLHLAIPISHRTEENHVCPTSITLRYKAQAGAHIQAIHLFDGEQKIQTITNLNLQSGKWVEHVIDIAHSIQISHGLSITLDAFFGETEREIEISGISCTLSAQHKQEA